MEYLSGFAVVVECPSCALIFWLGYIDFFGAGLFFVGDASVFCGGAGIKSCFCLYSLIL